MRTRARTLVLSLALAAVLVPATALSAQSGDTRTARRAAAAAERAQPVSTEAVRSVDALAGLQLEWTGQVAPEAVTEIGRLMGARIVITGVYVDVDGNVRVEARIAEGAAPASSPARGAAARAQAPEPRPAPAAPARAAAPAAAVAQARAPAPAPAADRVRPRLAMTAAPAPTTRYVEPRARPMLLLPQVVTGVRGQLASALRLQPVSVPSAGEAWRDLPAMAVLYAKALALQEDGELDEAIELYRQITLEFPELTEAREALRQLTQEP